MAFVGWVPQVKRECGIVGPFAVSIDPLMSNAPTETASVDVCFRHHKPPNGIEPRTYPNFCSAAVPARVAACRVTP